MAESSTSLAASLKQPVIKPKTFPFTQKKLEHVKNKLLSCIDAISASPSVFNQIAKFWDNRPWWQKISLA